MSSPILIRDERPEDIPVIATVTRDAFLAHPDSGQAEARIVDALRTARALTLSLVAEVDARVVGHIGFSPVDISDGSQRWYGLGPLSVSPGMQRRGIGSRLVRSGMDRLRALDANGCVVLGELDFYGRFGFGGEMDLILQGLPQTFFHAVLLCGSPAHGRVAFHPVFGVGAGGTA